MIESYEPIESKYANVAKGEEEPEDKPPVDVNDPCYWKGASWVGPLFIRGEKRKVINPGASTMVVPNMNTKFSRDGRKWFSSYESTFTEEELEAQRVDKENKSWEKYACALEERYQKRKEESYQYYLETGEEDSFACVEREEREFDERMAILDAAMYENDEEMNEDNMMEYETDSLSD